MPGVPDLTTVQLYPILSQLGEQAFCRFTPGLGTKSIW